MGLHQLQLTEKHQLLCQDPAWFFLAPTKEEVARPNLHFHTDLCHISFHLPLVLSYLPLVMSLFGYLCDCRQSIIFSSTLSTPITLSCHPAVGVINLSSSCCTIMSTPCPLPTESSTCLFLMSSCVCTCHHPFQIHVIDVGS